MMKTNISIRPTDLCGNTDEAAEMLRLFSHGNRWIKQPVTTKSNHLSEWLDAQRIKIVDGHYKITSLGIIDICMVQDEPLDKQIVFYPRSVGWFLIFWTVGLILLFVGILSGMRWAGILVGGLLFLSGMSFFLGWKKACELSDTFDEVIH